MPKATVNGIAIDYETHGSGDIALLFVSGTGVTRQTWLPFQVPFFAQHYTCIAYDHRGLGESDKPAGPYSTRLFASDAAGLLDALGIERAFIMGHSMGGRVCQWIALDFPEKVRAMVLSSTGSGQVEGAPPMERAVPIDTVEEMVKVGYERYYAEHFGANEFMFPKEFIAQNAEVIRQREESAARSRPPLRCYLEHVRARQCHETGDLLDRITAPTLCIVGGADHSEAGTGDHVTSTRQLAERIPGAIFQVIPGGAHAYLWQKAADANAAVLAFLQQH
jgi:pimeloyl-ACP methyl ester carboxylesterase